MILDNKCLELIDQTCKDVFYKNINLRLDNRVIDYFSRYKTLSGAIIQVLNSFRNYYFNKPIPELEFKCKKPSMSKFNLKIDSQLLDFYQSSFAKYQVAINNILVEYVKYKTNNLSRREA
jgi:hypothetical protein